MRVGFVTNRPAHYRVPFLRMFADHLETDFYFTANSTSRWWTSEHEESVEGLRAVNALSAFDLYRSIRRGQYDCVIGTLAGRTHLAALSAAVDIGGRPFVLWVELWKYPLSVIHAVGRPLVSHLLRRADAVVAGGAHTARWIEAENGRVDDVIVLKNPVDTDLFGQPVARDMTTELRATFALNTPAVACFVGRLEREKGLPYLLRAISLMQTRLGIVVIGSGSDADSIDRCASRWAITDRVRRTGWVRQDALPMHYQACDFLVIPSVSTRLSRESWGLVANEAMMGGLPVVATDAVGAAAGGLIEDGVTGLVVPERDASALAAALDTLSSDPRLRKKLGANARARAATYTFEQAASTFISAAQHAVRSRDSP